MGEATRARNPFVHNAPRHSENWERAMRARDKYTVLSGTEIVWWDLKRAKLVKLEKCR